MDAPGVGGLGGTFIGNPLSCAAALAVLDFVEREGLNDRAKRLGERFSAKATAWRERWSIIGEIHGMGAMRSLELVRDRQTREPATEAVKAITRYCYENGVITISAGTYGNIIRLLMPLIISEEHFEEAMSVLETAIAHSSGAGFAVAANRSEYV
jgi:4-aminobutyrate aminotransferase/(S)-3-amino-2-methylpropionate transaminase